MLRKANNLIKTNSLNKSGEKRNGREAIKPHEV